MSGNFSGGSFSGAVGGFSVDAIPTGGGGEIRHRIKLGQDRGETEAEKLARRISEGTLPAPFVPVQQDSEQAERYRLESARLALAISMARDDAAAAKAEIERLEQAQIKRQTAKLQKQLLHAQQAHQLAMVQEAVFLEEMEVVDIAFVASTVLNMVLQ